MDTLDELISNLKVFIGSKKEVPSHAVKSTPARRLLDAYNNSISPEDKTYVPKIDTVAPAPKVDTVNAKTGEVQTVVKPDVAKNGKPIVYDEKNTVLPTDTKDTVPPKNNPVMNDNIQLTANTPLNTLSNFLDTVMPAIGHIETNGGKVKDRKGSQYKGTYQLGKAERSNIITQLGYTEADYNASREVQEKVGRQWFTNMYSYFKKKGIAPTTMNAWLYHNMGAGGRRQIVKGKVSKGVLKRIRKQAGMDSNSTVSDYKAKYTEKLNSLLK